MYEQAETGVPASLRFRTLSESMEKTFRLLRNSKRVTPSCCTAP